jgi:hypothetical protein
MFEHELSQDDKQRMLAGAIHNNIGTATVFSPWYGQDFCYRDGMLCRTQNAPSDKRSFEPICTVLDVMVMDESAIWKRVMGGQI